MEVEDKKKTNHDIKCEDLTDNRQSMLLREKKSKHIKDNK